MDRIALNFLEREVSTDFWQGHVQDLIVNAVSAIVLTADA